MQTINNMYKKTPSLEETEISKLESLLTQVGADARSILLKADEISMAEFLDTCIRNGITFQLHENLLQKGTSEKEESSHKSSLTDDNLLGTQSPSEEKKASENSFVEAEECGERITLENWKGLLQKGQPIICKDEKEGTTVVKTVTQLEDYEYWEIGGDAFMELNHDWVWFEDDDTCEEGFSYYVKK
tara:strand:+ start:78197 stop:78757 length:561 start_codon:yes stop_codon:yes gene_type:complete